MNSNNYGIIMAGGIGSRFWPMSRTAMPKQFLDILGTGETLIQTTYNRLSRIIPSDQIFIVTNAIYEHLILEQLPKITPAQILKEPSRRNTAPCITYASFKIKKLNPNANVVVAPSDHLIVKEDAFIETLELALTQARTTGHLVTLGIKPSRPETGYGYIQFDDESHYANQKVKPVKTFTEKPDIDLANRFLESGDFYWNSGIFIWSNQTLLSEMERYQNEIYGLFAEGEHLLGTEGETKFIESVYSVSPNISIDYGIMEKAENVDIVLSDFGWSDLGTWGSLYQHMSKDALGNAVTGKRTKLYDAENCLVRMPNDKIAVIQGLKDFIVVEANNTLLICHKDEEQRIRHFVTDLKLSDI